MTIKYKCFGLFLTLTLFFTYSLSAEEALAQNTSGSSSIENKEDSSKDSSNEEATSEKKIPSYSELMLLNSLIPGTGQFSMNNSEEAWFYIWSAPLSLAGNAMVLYYYFCTQGGIDLSMVQQDGKTYPFTVNARNPNDDWILYSGTVLALYGSLLGAYSEWALQRDYVDLYAKDLDLVQARVGRESLGELILAPYNPKNFLSFDVWPVIALNTATTITSDNIKAIQNFFTETDENNVLVNRTFWGYEMNPYLAFGARLVSALVLVSANATWEEIFYRGILLERDGIEISSFNFGLGHLGNMIMPGVSVADTMLQTLYATAFGFYTADMTKKSAYKIDKAVTLHFWNNIIAFTLDYLINPEAQSGLTIGISLEY